MFSIGKKELGKLLLGLVTGITALAPGTSRSVEVIDQLHLPIDECLVNYPDSDAGFGDLTLPESFQRNGSEPHRIVLQFLILRRADGTGGITDFDLLPAMMRDLNHGYRNSPFVFVAMPDFIYVDDDDWYTQNTVEEALEMMTALETPGVVNIFFSDQLLFDAFQARAYTSAFSPRGHIYGDVVGLPYATPFPPHEMGHLFWLYHPYESRFGTECADGSNCASAGDFVCDTPASPIVFGGTNGNTTATGIYFGTALGPCPGDPPFAPRTDVYMEAGWSIGHAGYMYRDAFTDGQNLRMLQTLFVHSVDLVGPLRPEVLVDCDGDGIDDIGAILAGDEIDLNSDMVLDECQVYANDGDLLVSGMHAGQTNRPRYFDGTTGDYRGDLWSGAGWIHQFRLGPDGLIYMPSLTVIQRMSLTTGRLVDNFIDGVLEGAGTFVDLLWDDAGDLLILDNVSRNIRRYDGTDGTYLGVFTDLAPTGMSSPKYMEYGPDGNIYIVGNGALGNTIQMVDRTAGTTLGSFITPGAGLLGAGQGLVFHSDGYLYVSNRTNNSVIRYDALTGDFVDIFVSPGLGGLSNPHSLEFGPDGNLYVASRNSNSVKRYNSVTRAYMGDFVSPGAGGPSGFGGVTQPAGILFLGEDVATIEGEPGLLPNLASRPSYPNPFTSSTTIRFELREATAVDIRIYDVNGALVRKLAERQFFSSGRQSLLWDGSTTNGKQAGPGVYFYDMDTRESHTEGRLVITR